MATIAEIVQKMQELGYKISTRQFRYWYELGLLPAGEKRGGFKEGVRLVFSDPEEVINRIKKICDLKGKNYRLNEIAEICKKEEREKALKLRKKHLSNYVERDGRYFYHISEIQAKSADFIEADTVVGLIEAIKDIGDKNEKYLKNLGEIYALVDLLTDEAKHIDSIQLYQPRHIRNDRQYFNINKAAYDTLLPSQFLKETYGIEYNLQKRLIEKHRESVEKYLFFPKIDGIRFTKEWLGWKKQEAAELWPKLLQEYLWFKGKNVLIKKNDYGGKGKKLTFMWDYEYKNMNELTEDYLNGKCAFVPCVDAMFSRDYFLKRFYNGREETNFGTSLSSLSEVALQG
jgi:DNA-binding transcriptional MerR regulator